MDREPHRRTQGCLKEKPRRRPGFGTTTAWPNRKAMDLEILSVPVRLRFTALEALRDRGAHFVLARPDKHPLAAGWQKSAPDFETVIRHVEAGGLVGIIPSSIDAVVVDVDEGGDDGVLETILRMQPSKPITTSKTRRAGGWHLWYRAPSLGTGNRKWRLNGASGDIRGSAGFVVLWDPEHVAQGFELYFDECRAPNLARLPKPKTNGARGPAAVLEAPVGERNETLNREAFKAAKAGNLNWEAVRVAAMQSGLPRAEVEATIRSAAMAGGQAQEVHNHLSFARRFEATYSDDRRFWPERRRWMAWSDPAGWMESRTPQRDMAQIIEDATAGAERGKWCRVNHVRGAMALAAERLAHSEWDAREDWLGLPDGFVVDLKTNQRRLQTRNDYVTLSTGCDVADRVSPAWAQFVLETCGGDQEMADALQLAIGASAFGHNRHHRAEVFCGDGGTGKTTFLGTVEAAFGSYAGVLPASVLNSRTEQHPTGLAGIARRRFVSVPEVTGGTFKGATLKMISGGDAIPARHMRQDFFTFVPVCTLMIMTNEPPAVRLVDNAIRRRIRIWPLEAKPRSPDARLPVRLRAPDVLPGVLRWIVDGAIRYAEINGPFPDCRAVREATAQYFEATDSIGGWFAACCTAFPKAETAARDLFKSYGDWCDAEGVRPVTRTAWGTWMGRRVEKRRTKRGNVYGVALAGV